MTEAEWWLACDNPQKMLDSLPDKVSARKLRLFAVACSRMVWQILADNRSREAIEIAERFADGGLIDLARVWEAAGAVNPPEGGSDALRNTWHNAHSAAWNVADADALHAASFTADCATGAIVYSSSVASNFYDNWRTAENDQAVVLRDIFGNPFRSLPAIDPSWLRWHDATIPRLAQQMYDSRDFASMPILADALEEAGCTSADILDHCRGSGPHVRGCWVVDLLLGKE